jgi:riboflavin transporter FmnP
MNHEMKLVFQNVFIIPIYNSCIKFNINKINSVQTYNTVQHFRILPKAVQRLSQHNLKVSNHHHIQNLRQRK